MIFNPTVASDISGIDFERITSYGVMNYSFGSTIFPIQNLDADQYFCIYTSKSQGIGGFTILKLDRNKELSVIYEGYRNRYFNSLRFVDRYLLTNATYSNNQINLTFSTLGSGVAVNYIECYVDCSTLQAYNGYWYMNWNYTDINIDDNQTYSIELTRTGDIANIIPNLVSVATVPSNENRMNNLYITGGPSGTSGSNNAGYFQCNVENAFIVPGTTITYSNLNINPTQTSLFYLFNTTSYLRVLNEIDTITLTVNSNNVLMNFVAREYGSTIDTLRGTGNYAKVTYYV